MSRVTRRSSDNPRAAMPLARIALRLAAQGNIRVSKSGMNLSGQNSPASPNARPSWTTKHSHRVVKVWIPMQEFLFIGTDSGIEGKLRRLRFPWRLFLGTKPIRPHPPRRVYLG